jgi:opacity protein-like surface antigen
MKQLLLASVASVALATGSAWSADMAAGPAPVFKAPVMAPMYNWTGLYIGGHASYGWSSSTSTTTNTATGVAFPEGSGSSSAWHGGGQIGYDYMMPSRVVVGIVADVSSGNSSSTTNFGFREITLSQGKTNANGTVRGRLGYAINSFMLYGTGGWAWTDGQSSRTQLTGQVGNAVAGTVETVNVSRNGWVAGGGLAYEFLQNWNVFAEYQYRSFQAVTITFPIAQRSTNTTTTANTVEIGLNYKFDWGARY